MRITRNRTTLHVEFTVRYDQFLELGYWLVAIGLGTIQAWRSRFQPSSIDIVSYLDVADAYMRGNWSAAINGYWNPLYSWILGVVMAIVQPSVEFEYPVARLVDWVVYLACLFSFAWFLKNLRLTYRAAIADAEVAIPDWMWIVGGYTLFIWSSLRWISLTSSTPDMCGAALTYGALGLLLRAEQRGRWFHYPLLGTVLALSYFARTPMFIFATVMLLLAGVHRATPARRRGVVVAGVVFVAVTAPFIVSISRARGHLTIGDNGKLNYAWLVDPGSYIIPNRHWQGEPSGYGYPKHASRMLWDAPPAFAFAAPFGGTYAPWTDPSYWFEGLRYRFDAAAEWRAVKHNVRYYYELFGHWLLFGVAVALAMAGDLRSTLRAAARTIPYWAAAATGVALYLLTTDLSFDSLPMQPSSRYVAVFAVLLHLMAATSLRFRRVQPPALLKGMLAVGVAVVSFGMIATVTANELTALRQRRPMPPWQVAHGLQEVGVRAGMRITTIGKIDRHAFWARLARVQIIAEVPNHASFWAKSPDTQQLLLHVLAQTGAQIVVSEGIPMSALDRGWRLAKATNYGVYVSSDDAGADSELLSRHVP